MEPSEVTTKGPWSRWGNWTVGGLAVLANVVGVVQLVTETSGVLLTLAAGVFAVGVGGFWLWRSSSGKRVAVFALNLAMVVIGAGVIGFVASDLWRPDPKPQNPGTAPLPAGPFTGDITIRFPMPGWTMEQGRDVTGDVTEWKAGYQVWMSARADGTATELVQGPCAVDAGKFTCRNVQLPNGPTGKEFILVAVVTDAVAATLPGAAKLPVETALDYDQTQPYKG